MITQRIFIGIFLFSVACPLQFARAGDMSRPEDPAEVANYARKIDEEYAYRIRVDQEGTQWAKELMLLYKWPHLYPSNLHAMPDTPEAKSALQLRMRSEFAWMTITGQGILATFDFTHAEQTLLGSTSRFVGALEHSASFWREVRQQCIEIDELKRKASADPHRELIIEGCAARLKRDITITQVAGSNVSLFVGGGILVGIGKRLFTRYASKWVTVRVLPLIPAFARTRWALAGLTATVVLVPAGFILASARDDQESNKVFIESLPSRLDENRAEVEKASLMRVSLIKLEGDVLRFALWAQREMPKSADEASTRQFIVNMKLLAPEFTELSMKRDLLEEKRQALENELGSQPGISARLQALGEERKHRKLADDEAKLFSKAQYLASLRLVVKMIDASRSAN